MVEFEKEEATNLVNYLQFSHLGHVLIIFQQREFEWVLNQEVHKGLDQIHQILVVRFYLLINVLLC